MNKKSADNTAKKQPTGRPFKPGQSGNPKGRPPGTGYIKELEEAIHEVETEKKKSFFKRVIERAYISDSVLIAVLKKFVPDKTHAEIELAEDPETTMAEVREKLKKKITDISARLKKIKETDKDIGPETGEPESLWVQIEKKGTLSAEEKKPDKSKEVESKGMGYAKFDKITISG